MHEPGRQGLGNSHLQGPWLASVISPGPTSSPSPGLLKVDNSIRTPVRCDSVTRSRLCILQNKGLLGRWGGFSLIPLIARPETGRSSNNRASSTMTIRGSSPEESAGRAHELGPTKPPTGDHPRHGKDTGMLRKSLWLAAVALAAVVTTGCTLCDTCDDFPVPCAGGNCGGAEVAPVYPGTYSIPPGTVTTTAVVPMPAAAPDAAAPVPPSISPAPPAPVVTPLPTTAPPTTVAPSAVKPLALPPASLPAVPPAAVKPGAATTTPPAPLGPDVLPGSRP